MPNWKKSDRDSSGFPLTSDGKMEIEEKLAFLLEEVLALQLRVKSLEGSIQSVLRALEKS
jgi:hypothetical protein